MSDRSRRRAIERWIAWVRLGGVVFAVLEIAVFTSRFPPGYLEGAWVITACFALGTVVILWFSEREGDRVLRLTGFAALAFDTAVICAYAVLFSYEYGNQTRFALMVVVIEAALRYGLAGGVGFPVAAIPFLWFEEWWRVRSFSPPGPGFAADRVTFPAGILLLSGLIVGWLVRRLDREVAVGAERAADAERLRDTVARRLDVLEAANRCARALGSSLDTDRAFGAFIREARALVPFDRLGIVLLEDGEARVVAAAGRGAESVFPRGTSRAAEGSVLDDAVLMQRAVYREDMSDLRYPEEKEFLELGLRSRVVAPLAVGARPIGMISFVREQPRAFSQEDIELVALLGRLVANAVQNIRAYEAERQTVDELRRLSTLRADFVSLVSHELRSPMAAVIGAARTLQDRWRALTPEQRDAFLALIADETNRLASLIGDVLDTSRIDAGTFSFRFSDVDLGRLVEDAVASAALGQDEVRVRASVSAPVPPVRGDRERLRQVLANLIENAVKYSPAGEEVEVAVRPANGVVRIVVSDRGPGIPYDQQRVIFEKFVRAETPGSAKPGTGLGLFIARSIAEAHGGALEVRSRSGNGAAFVLTLPVGEATP